jgi:hypothetical protein
MKALFCSLSVAKIEKSLRFSSLSFFAGIRVLILEYIFFIYSDPEVHIERINSKRGFKTRLEG